MTLAEYVRRRFCYPSMIAHRLWPGWSDDDIIAALAGYAEAHGGMNDYVDDLRTLGPPILKDDYEWFSYLDMAGQLGSIACELPGAEAGFQRVHGRPSEAMLLLSVACLCCGDPDEMGYGINCSIAGVARYGVSGELSAELARSLTDMAFDLVVTYRSRWVASAMALAAHMVVLGHGAIDWWTLIASAIRVNPLDDRLQSFYLRLDAEDSLDGIWYVFGVEKCQRRVGVREAITNELRKGYRALTEVCTRGSKPSPDACG